MQDLIKTVELAEEGALTSPLSTETVTDRFPLAANLVDPQRTVQIFVDLVARHEARFYHFVHQVHSKGEGLFDNLMSWIELFINFVRDGLPSPVSLDFLLPVGGKEREDVLSEVDALIEYHRKLKAAHHERMKKRMVKGQELDKDADAAFVSGVMQNLHIGGVMDDVDELANEGSEDEAEDEGVASSDEDEASPVPGSSQQQQGAPQIKHPRQSKKKDRVPIDPPHLVHIPQLVPIFVELVRSFSPLSPFLFLLTLSPRLVGPWRA